LKIAFSTWYTVGKRRKYDKALGGGGQAIFLYSLVFKYVIELSFIFPMLYNMYMAKLHGSSGILAQTRVVVKAEADFPYCFI